MDFKKIDKVIKNNKTYYILKCMNCGKISKPIRSDRVKNFACKCDYVPIKIGDRYGKLTIVEKLGQLRIGKGRARSYFLVKCDCGNLVKIREDHLRTGNSSSCGKCPTILTANRHLVNRASNILQRCNNRNSKSFMSYGGLGIKCNLGTTIKDVVASLCQVPNYKEGYEIDRVDPLKDYTIVHEVHKSKIWYSDDFPEYPCLGNLRWVPKKVNSLNKKVIKKLAKIYGVMYMSKNNYIGNLVCDYIKFCKKDINIRYLGDFIEARDLEDIFSAHFKKKFIREFRVQRLFLKRK